MPVEGCGIPLMIYGVVVLAAALLLVLGKSQVVRRIGLVLCVAGAFLGVVAPHLLRQKRSEIRATITTRQKRNRRFTKR